MNTKVEATSQPEPVPATCQVRARGMLVAVAGVVVFYLLPASGPRRFAACWSRCGLRRALVDRRLDRAMVIAARDFFSESLFELRKVVWPTRQEAMRITGVVLLVVLIISLILAGFDFVISVG